MDLEEILKAVFTGTEVEVYRMDEEGLAPIVRREPATMEQWELYDEMSGLIYEKGDIVYRSDGEEMILEGGRPPHTVASTGRVFVRWPEDEPHQVAEYFPSVVGLKWRYKKL